MMLYYWKPTIKVNQPRYNVMLKDGKTYSYICIANEDFPRVFLPEKYLKMGVFILDLTPASKFQRGHPWIN